MGAKASLANLLQRVDVFAIVAFLELHAEMCLGIC